MSAVQLPGIVISATDSAVLPANCCVSVQVTVGDTELDGFRLKLIDTCGLEDPEAGDTVNYTALQRIAEDIKGVQVDVVMYVDRLDLYRVEPLDKRVRQ